MTEKLTYNNFRSAHKGTPQKEISKLWADYKEGKYELPLEETVEEVLEVTEEETVEPEPVKEEVVPEKTAMDKCKDYEKYRRQLHNFGFRYNEVETKKIEDRMIELAKETIPSDYSCTPTDSWKLWLGPTQECLLINTTELMAFKVDRSWWSKHYQNTIYVDRELLKDNTLMEKTAQAFALKQRYIPRTPVVGVECKLPQGVKDIQVRGGQGMK